MAVTLQELLLPQVILDLISRVRPGQGHLGQWLGFHPTTYDKDTVQLSGPATVNGMVRYANFRVFNNSRVPSNFRAAATGPGTVPRNPLGQVPVVCLRSHDKIPLNYEEMGNLAVMTGPNSQIDQMGQSYIKAQQTYLAGRFASNVEMMAAGMMRDSLYGLISGDNIVPSFTAPNNTTTFGFQVPFQIPAGNKNQLNMLGAGNIITVPWSNVGAPIIDNLLAIEAAFAQLTGYSMTDVWINSITWGLIIKNTSVRNAAGSSITPFAEFDREPELGMDGRPTTKYLAILRGIPTVKFHICNDIVALGGNQIDPIHTYSTATASKLIPDGMAIFCTQPNPEVCKLYLGGEPVVEYPGAPAVIRSGYYFWTEPVTQPSAIDQIGLMNAIPLLLNPFVFAPATVDF
jgi:hypothetical protein